MHCGRIVPIFLFLLTLGGAESALAHATTKAETWVNVLPDGKVTVRLDLQEKDILELFDVDMSSEREQSALDAVLERHLPSALVLHGNNTPCPLRLDKTDASPMRVRITAAATCPPDLDTLRIDWGLSKRSSLDVMGLATITAPGDIRHVDILSRDKPTLEVSVKKASPLATFVAFIQHGFMHLITGWDHLAFLLLLLLGCATFRRAAVVATAFTLAHSVTLALAATGLFVFSASIIEPAIALSIAATGLFVAFQRIRQRPTYPGARSDEPPTTVERWGAVAIGFSFGLLHGLGFAGFLSESLAGFSGADLVLPLLAFNLGLEGAQLSAVIVAFPLLVLFGRRPFASRVYLALSVALTLLGAYWTLERVFEW